MIVDNRSSTLVATLVRELCERSHLPRGGPPSQTLPTTLIQSALQDGGNTNGRFAAGYLFHTARITQTISGARSCVDLGAAPGCQLLQLAELNPEIEFVGIDRNETLLEDGKSRTKSQNLKNVSWQFDDIRKLSTIRSNSIDAVISTMTLHDMIDSASLVSCLKATKRILAPDHAVYIEDYARLRSTKSIEYFNRVNTRVPGDPFAKLNDCSMRAAFKIGDLKRLFAEYFPELTLHSTFMIPFLNVFKTKDRSLAQEKKRKLMAMRRDLSNSQMRDLDDLRKFFRLGGWRNDPFDS